MDLQSIGIMALSQENRTCFEPSREDAYYQTMGKPVALLELIKTAVAMLAKPMPFLSSSLFVLPAFQTDGPSIDTTSGRRTGGDTRSY